MADEIVELLGNSKLRQEVLQAIQETSGGMAEKLAVFTLTILALASMAGVGVGIHSEW